jgi:CRISPR/Cas system-associated exonuclease Cas4 (RecB family)
MNGNLITRQSCDDSTKTNSYLDCPRKYFYEFVLNWIPDFPRHDLEFGEAWHRGMEHLTKNGNHRDEVLAAHGLFLDHYRKHFGEHTDADYAPKNPQYAQIGYLSYAIQNADDRHKYEVLYTEVAGSVMMSQGLSIAFRIDAILRELETGKVIVLEHKTTKSDRSSWYQQWPLAIQLGTYIYALYCMFPPEEVGGALVNGSIFTKKEIKHVRVPVRKTPRAMDAWHADVLYWLTLIEEQYDRIQRCTESDGVMEAFPRNPGNCTKYFGCPFHDFCINWPNPLQHCDQVPSGFIEYRWDPRDREKEANKVVNF